MRLFGKKEKNHIISDGISSVAEAADRGIVRIFISSTFNDLNQERDALNRDVMPYINNLLKARGIDAACVDLRWGLTKEESRHGLTASVCFDEIDACRPFFFGIIGDRYGWIPEVWSSDDLKRFNWVDPKKGLSMTELEMTYGAFLCSRKDTRAAFIIKTNNNTDKAEQKMRKRLVARIRKSGYPVAEYSDMASFVEKSKALINDMTADIAASYAEDGNSSERSFAIRTRKLLKVFSGRESLSRSLDRFAAGKSRYCLLSGARGCGKSALLANWTSQEPDSRIIYYADAADNLSWQDALVYMINRISGKTLARRDDEDASLRRMFRTALGQAAAGSPLTLVFDGAELLRDSRSGFGWLPDELPDNAHIILSANGDEAISGLRSLMPEEIYVDELSVNEKKDTVKRFLSSYGKKLDATQTNMLLYGKYTGNARFLRTVLEELRLRGSFEKLNSYILEYIDSKDNNELFEHVAGRIMKDYPASEKILPFLVCSEQPVLESEILGLCGVTQLEWSSLRTVIEPYISGVSGVKIISEELRAALLETYSADNEVWKRTVERYIDYYGKRGADRKARMLPDLLSQSGRCNDLLDLLSDPESLAAFYRLAPRRCNELITRAQSLTGRALAETLAGDPEYDDMGDLTVTAVCLLDLGYAENAEKRLVDVIEKCRLTSDRYNEQYALGYLARIKQRSGDLYNAERLLEKKREICRELNMDIELARTTGNIGLLCLMAGKLDEAEQAVIETKEKYAAIGYGDGEQIAEGHLGNIALRRGNIEEARSHYHEQMRLSTLGGNPYGQSAALGGLGQAAIADDRYKEAEELFSKQIKLCGSIGDNDGLQTALGNSAVAAVKQGNKDNAEKLLRRKIGICKETGNISGLDNGMANLANLLIETDRKEEAEKVCLERAEFLKNSGSFIEHLADALCALARVQIMLDKKPEANNSALQAKTIAGQLGQAAYTALADSILAEIRA